VDTWAAYDPDTSAGEIQQILKFPMHVISLLGHVSGVQVGLGEV
jgi:hypothetical protein